MNLESIAVNFIREKRKVMMVSVISEIGVATVNYDMRRLSEILAFPKAWYNRSRPEMLLYLYIMVKACIYLCILSAAFSHFYNMNSDDQEKQA